MQYNAYKERVVRVASHLLVRCEPISESRVESILRDGLNARILEEPSLGVDHLRVAMVEYGLLHREETGSRYRIDLEVFAGTANIQGIFGKHYPAERIRSVDHLVNKISRFAAQHDLIAI